MHKDHRKDPHKDHRKDPTATAAALLPLVGGPANVTSVTHCMTRLRLGLADRSRVEEAALRALPGVLGVVEDGDSYQVVLGPGVVGRVTEAFEALLAAGGGGMTTGGAGPADAPAGTADKDAPTGSPAAPTGSPAAPTGPADTPTGTADALARRGAELKARRKRRNATPLKTALRRVADIFVPLIPALIGCGIVAGIAGLLTNLRWLPGITPALAALSSAFMALIAVFVGHNTAKEFGGTPVLGGAIAAVVVYPGVAKVTAFGMALAPGQGGVLGALAAALLGTRVEKWCRARLPGTLDVLLTPTLTVLVSGLVTLYVLMYAAGEVATAIGTAANWLLATTGALAGLVLGGLFLPLVMLGLHQALIPLHTTLIEQQGHTVLLPVLAMAGAGQVGAAAAVYVRLRHDTTLRATIRSALPAGLLGVGEPLIYGVSLPLGRPFLTACVGGAAGGAFVGLFAMLGTDVGTTAIGPSGWALFPLLAGGGWAVTAGVYGGGLLTGYLAGFAATYFFGLPDGTARTVCDSGKHEPRPADRPGPRPASPR
ncbi:PTS transporter subunit EIIC [Streptomyces sp. MH13]|uniref:PTS transporter subunit EIIC n=1 Tax=Streptomyces sp. MH13 TaxID=3417651 RepID=UPI003CFADB1F